MTDFEILSPVSKAELLSLIADGDEETRLIAGGTGILNLIKRRVAHPERLVSLHKIHEMMDVEIDDAEVRIGALCHLLDLEHLADLHAKLPLIPQVLHEIASPRIRDMATLGGAIAHGDPGQDMPVALLALDAVVTVESESGSREIVISEFLNDYYETALIPGEIVTGIRVPFPAAASRFSYKKFLPASCEDYACVSVCVRLDLDGDRCTDARIVLGSAGPTVFRATAAERKLKESVLTEETILEAAELAAEATDPIDDTRGSRDYKQRMANIWTARMVKKAAGFV